MKNYTYKWQSNPTIAKSKKYGTCVTYVACVLQRIGILKSGEYIWIDNKGKVYGANSKMTVTYMKGTVASNKAKFKKGDILIGGNGNVDAGGGSHIFILTGKWSDDNPYIYDQASADRVKQGKKPQHTWKGSFKMIALIRLKDEGDKPTPTPTPDPKQGYQGKFPTYRLTKSNSEVKADACTWAKKIADNNDFHYGKGKAAHHNGCYYCGTQPKAKRVLKMWETTYCCNPFVGAAWAHGGGDATAYKMCHEGKSWDFGKGNGSYHKSKLFDNLGHPAKSKLQAGDVLCNDGHVALYIGGGKIAEAGAEDDNVIRSKKWDVSIRVKTLSDVLYKKFSRAYRYKGKVDCDRVILKGEYSTRVADMQRFLVWYGYKIKVTGFYNSETLKAVIDFQEKELGKGQGDGSVGPKTIEAMKKARK